VIDAKSLLCRPAVVGIMRKSDMSADTTTASKIIMK
jgi:hypothetical protein